MHCGARSFVHSRVKDIHARRGAPHLRVRGKGGKTRYIPLHPGTQGLVTDYLEAARLSQCVSFRQYDARESKEISHMRQ